MNFDIRSRAVAEFLGTGFLLAAVVGSGIMGERLAGGNVAIALLANTLSTVAMLVVLILTLAPISGAHFNPVVTLAVGLRGDLPWREAPIYLASQVMGAFGFRSRYVRPAFISCIDSCPPRCGSTVERSCGYFRAGVRDLGLLAVPALSYRLRGRSLHHFGVLVYGIDIVRESRSHISSFGQRHVCGNSSCRRARIHGGAIRRRFGGERSGQVVGPRPWRPSGRKQGVDSKCGRVVPSTRKGGSSHSGPCYLHVFQCPIPIYNATMR
jgi:hypothetical protein